MKITMDMSGNSIISNPGVLVWISLHPRNLLIIGEVSVWGHKTEAINIQFNDSLAQLFLQRRIKDGEEQVYK